MSGATGPRPRGTPGAPARQPPSSIQAQDTGAGAVGQQRRRSRCWVRTTGARQSASMKRQPLGGVAGVQRHVGAARLQHRQQRHDQRRASAPGTPPPASRGPRPAPRRRRARRSARPVQLAVGEARPVADQRRSRSGARAAWAANSSCDAGVGRTAGGGAFHSCQHLPRSRGGEQRQLDDPAARDRRPAPSSSVSSGRACARSWRRRRGRGCSSSRPEAVRPLAELERRGRTARRLDGKLERASAVSPAASASRRGGVLQGEHHLEERRAAQVALRLQLLHQPLEGHVLVGVGARAPSRGPGPAESRKVGIARTGRCAAPGC